MAEYIERGDLLNNRPEGRNPGQVGKEEYNKGWNDCRSAFVECIVDEPAADVAPVVHGNWIPFEHWVHKTYWKGKACSVCNANIGHKTVFKFCPNCGARMDGE